MAIRDKDNEGKEVITYQGCVIETRERNYYDDSDFYAVVWDDASQSIKEITYASTRYGGGGYAAADVTPEVMEKVNAYCAEKNRHTLRASYERDAKTPKMDKLCRVFKGRKVAKGTTGKVVWIGPREKFGYYSDYRQKVCIALDDEKVIVEKQGKYKTFRNERYKNVAYTDISNLEVIDWEQYMPSESDIERRAAHNAYSNYRSWMFAGVANLLYM